MCVAGKVSRSGLVAYASSLDCPGVLARSVADALMVVNTMACTDGDAKAQGLQQQLLASAQRHRNAACEGTELLLLVACVYARELGCLRVRCQVSDAFGVDD